MSARISLEGVSKRFEERVALQPAHLSFAPGATTAVIGPSGCGKSTLLRLIIGLIEPDTGKVLIDGTEVDARNAMQLRRRIGYVIQTGGLFPHLTARDNILMMARYLKRPREQNAERLLELCRLTHFPHDGLDRYPLELSGGQRQRVSLMRALMLEPAALLLDEPLGALDPIVRASLQEELKRIFAELRQTVVLVTHDIGEAAFLADTIVLMEAGRVVQVGTYAELAERPASEFVTEFLRARARVTHG